MPPNSVHSISRDLHIDNCRIWTGDVRRPWARSLTIRQGRIVAIDDPPAQGVPAIDLGGAAGHAVTPGLIDAHLHLLTGGKSLERLDLSNIRSRSEFERAIAQQHAALPAGQWLLAWGWSQENWGGELPTKDWLRGVGDRPAGCLRMDMHIGLVNDAVLAMCDLRNNPSGGTIVRDVATGQPTGLMVEAALWQLVNPLIPEPDIEARRRILRLAQRHAHSLGLTAVGSMEYSDDLINVYEPLRDELTLRSRITLLDRAWPMKFDLGAKFRGDEMLAVIGYKAFIDGTLGSRTARMLADYSDDPGNRGLLVELAKDGNLTAWAKGVAAAGAGGRLSPSMHAIGDEAVRLALDVVEAVGPAMRPRIEHAQQIDLADILRFRGGVIASMQPLHKADDCRSIRPRLGESRLSGTFAFRRLADAGAVLAFGSDWPVVSADPLLGIRAAVTGLTLDGEVFGADQNLSVEEAMRAYTAGAAYCLGMDGTEGAGVLREGMLGDLVVFDRDPFEADWANEMPRVMMTVAGGRVVYDQRDTPVRA